MLVDTLVLGASRWSGGGDLSAAWSALQTTPTRSKHACLSVFSARPHTEALAWDIDHVVDAAGAVGIIRRAVLRSVGVEAGLRARPR